MKKLISLLCIAAVGITFSYTDIAEAMNNVDEQEMNFINSNTKSQGRKAKKNRSGQQRKQRRKNRKNKRQQNVPNMIAPNAYQGGMNNNMIAPNAYQGGMNNNDMMVPNAYNENYEEAYRTQDGSFQQKKNKKRRRNKKNKQNRRNRGRQEEVLYHDAQYNMRSGNDMYKQGKKQRRSKKKNEKSNNDDWKDVIALADEHGHVTNPEVNGTMITVNNSAKTKKVLRKKPAIRITKGLTPHIALGTDTEQLIQPKHNNKRDLKESIQLRQELEKYRKMFAQAPISDETA